MMKLPLQFLVCMLFGCSLMLKGQEPVPLVQPAVMVVPFAKEGERMRWIFEHDYSSHLRVAVANVKDGLSQKGIRTIDFRAVVRQLNPGEAMTHEQQVSVKQEVIELSGADVYVETEAQVILTPTGNSVTVILNAFDVFTGQSLVTKLGHSPKFYTSNYEKLTQKAIENCLEDFSNALAESFRNIHNNGRTIAVDIGIGEDSEIDLDSELDTLSGQLLSDIIEGWMEENAHHGQYHIQGVTATKIIFNSVAIPAKDQLTGKRYSPTKFAARLRKFLTGLGLNVIRDVQGSKVFITILG